VELPVESGNAVGQGLRLSLIRLHQPKLPSYLILELGKEFLVDCSGCRRQLTYSGHALTSQKYLPGLRFTPFAPRAGFAKVSVERLFSVMDYGKGVNPGPQESSERRRPSVIEGSTYARQVTIDDGRNPDLAAANIRFQPLPLACKPLQSMNFGRG